MKDNDGFYMPMSREEISKAEMSPTPSNMTGNTYLKSKTTPNDKFSDKMKFAMHLPSFTLTNNSMNILDT